MNTLFLDPTSWDLALDVNGDIALAQEPYSLAQDAASAIRLFVGEAWYDTTQGVPYGTILGKAPSASYIKAQLEKAALTVPDVASATCFLTSLQGRSLGGQVQVTSKTTGLVSVAVFQVVAPPPKPLPFGP